MNRKTQIIITAAIITALSLGTLVHAVVTPAQADSADKAGDYLLSQRTAAGDIGGLGYSAWALQALSAVGKTSPATLQFLADNVETIVAGSATDIERTILAVIAGGGNPRDFGGHDLVATLKSKAQDGQIGSPDLTNDDIFGILALLAAGESVSDEVLNGAINYLIASQRENGSFSWSTTGDGDSNDTAMAIQALALAQQRGASVAYNQSTAVDYLKSNQYDDGGFGYQPGFGADGSSTAWIISAIIALGEDPEDWVKNGNDPYDYLRSLQASSGGVSWQAGFDPDLFTTSFATIAFAGRSLPVATTSVESSPSPTPSPNLSPSPSPSPSPSSSPSPSPTPETTSEPSPNPRSDTRASVRDFVPRVSDRLASRINDSRVSPSPTVSNGITTTLTVGSVEYDVIVAVDSTVFDVMEAAKTQGFTFETQEFAEFGKFVTAINGVSQGDSEFWLYEINGEPAMEGIETQKVNDGDTISWELVSFAVSAAESNAPSEPTITAPRHNTPERSERTVSPVR